MTGDSVSNCPSNTTGLPEFQAGFGRMIHNRAEGSSPFSGSTQPPLSETRPFSPNTQLRIFSIISPYQFSFSQHEWVLISFLDPPFPFFRNSPATHLEIIPRLVFRGLGPEFLSFFPFNTISTIKLMSFVPMIFYCISPVLTSNSTPT